MTEVPHALEVTPESVLQFTLSKGNTDENSSRCLLTLKHNGKTDKYLAFKVKTTQPRRYLVRPNQGIVEPGNSVSITIITVEKDRQALIQAFDRLGQSALDHSKDKFLVQSCVVDTEFAKRYLAEKSKTGTAEDPTAETNKTGKDLADELTKWWNTASSSGSPHLVNRKLQVRHVVQIEGASGSANISNSNSVTSSNAATASSSTTGGGKAPSKPDENMTSEEMLSEISSLRRKYDELVSFSVNLTAERDILNNTLEQTKRDLNRETAARAALENRLSEGAVGTTKSVKGGEGASGAGLSFILTLLLCIILFLVGVKVQKDGLVDFLFELPVMGDLLLLKLGDGDEL